MVKIKFLIALNSPYTIYALFQFKDYLSLKSKNDFIDFYKKLDKVTAKRYSITLSFFLPECREVASIMMLINNNEKNKIDKFKKKYLGINQLRSIYDKNPNNPFALLNLGKLYMKGAAFHFMSDPVKAIDYIQKAAQKNVPEALFECGKIHFCGFICPPDTKMAFNYFWKASNENNRDYRAGYYLSN